MKQASLAVLEGFKTHFLENPLHPVKRADLASVISIILGLFDQVEEEGLLLAECVDDLARHTGFQLKEKANHL